METIYIQQPQINPFDFKSQRVSQAPLFKQTQAFGIGVCAVLLKLFGLSYLWSGLGGLVLGVLLFNSVGGNLLILHLIQTASFFIRLYVIGVPKQSNGDEAWATFTVESNQTISQRQIAWFDESGAVFM